MRKLMKSRSFKTKTNNTTNGNKRVRRLQREKSKSKVIAATVAAAAASSSSAAASKKLQKEHRLLQSPQHKQRKQDLPQCIVFRPDEAETNHPHLPTGTNPTAECTPDQETSTQAAFLEPDEPPPSSLSSIEAEGYDLQQFASPESDKPHPDGDADPDAQRRHELREYLKHQLFILREIQIGSPTDTKRTKKRDVQETKAGSIDRTTAGQQDYKMSAGTIADAPVPARRRGRKRRSKSPKRAKSSAQPSASCPTIVEELYEESTEDEKDGENSSSMVVDAFMSGPMIVESDRRVESFSILEGYVDAQEAGQNTCQQSEPLPTTATQQNDDEEGIAIVVENNDGKASCDQLSRMRQRLVEETKRRMYKKLVRTVTTTTTTTTSYSLVRCNSPLSSSQLQEESATSSQQAAGSPGAQLDDGARTKTHSWSFSEDIINSGDNSLSTTRKDNGPNSSETRSLMPPPSSEEAVARSPSPLMEKRAELAQQRASVKLRLFAMREKLNALKPEQE